MEEILGNYLLFIIPLIMWFVAQIIKFIIYSVKHGVDWKYLFEYGHNNLLVLEQWLYALHK